MPLTRTDSYLKDSLDVFRYYKTLAERAMAQCTDAQLFECIDKESNSIAIIVKHLAGNMRSRWRDFLISDGEKPDRNPRHGIRGAGDDPRGANGAMECGLELGLRRA